MKKRFLSILLSLCMLMSFLPVSALAADIVDSGVCGSNLTWTLDSNGTLTIAGTGEMTDYRPPDLIDGKELSPWCKNLDVKNVVIQSGVTNIGEYSFYYCEKLSMVNMPNSIVSIGGGAFAGCTALADVNLPAHVTTIGNNAFLNCSSLSDIVIPPSVTTIGMNGFSDCSNIENLTIPVTLDVYNGVSQNDFRRNIFTGCSAISHVKITGIGDMPDYTMSRFSIAGTSKEFPVGAPWYIGSEYGNSVTVDISNGITNISDWAFRDCKNMTQITIPTSVQTIGYSAFTGCSGLTDVYFGGSKEQWETISVGSGNDRLSASDITIHYNSSGNITNESTFVGTWEIDDEKTMAVNGESMTSIFGHDYGKYGSEMNLNADHTFTYGIAVGIGGEGDWRFDGSQIIYNIITYEEGQNESGTLQIESYGEDEYYLCNDLLRLSDILEESRRQPRSGRRDYLPIR